MKDHYHYGEIRLADLKFKEAISFNLPIYVSRSRSEKVAVDANGEQARASARGVLLRVNLLAINGELANRPSEPRENARLLSRSALA